MLVSFKDGRFFVSTTVENTHQRIDVKVVSFQGENTGTWLGQAFESNRPVQRKEDWATWREMCISAMRLDNTEKYGLKLEPEEMKFGLKIMGTEMISPIIKKILFERILEKVEDHGPSVQLQQMMTNLSLHMMGPIAAQERNTAALKLQTAYLVAETERIKTVNDANRADWLQKTSILLYEKTREINRLNSIVKSVQGDDYNDDDHGSDVEQENDDDGDEDDNSNDNRQKHMPLLARKQLQIDHDPQKVTAVSLQGHPKGSAESKTSSASSSSGINRSTRITAGPLESSRSATTSSTNLTQDISFLDLPSGTHEIDAADLHLALSLSYRQKEIIKQQQQQQQLEAKKTSPATTGLSTSFGSGISDASDAVASNIKKKRKGFFYGSPNDSDTEK